MVSYLSAPQNKFLRFRMLQSLNCNYNFNGFILGLNVWQRIAQVHYIDQLHECCLPKQFFHLIKIPWESTSMSSLCSFSDIILLSHVCLWPWKITATNCGINSIYTFLSLSTVVPPTLFYVNQPTVMVSTVSYHHLHLCEQNNYVSGGVQFTGLKHP
jgi:hypothetical protein